MEYMAIGVIVAVVIVVILFIFKLSKQDNKKSIIAPFLKVKDLKKELECEIKNELIIHIDMLPVETIEDDSKLVEITDKKVLAHVNKLVPGLLQVGNAVNNTVKTVAKDKIVYRVILPAGAKLANSKDLDGAFRGIYRGVNGIQGHANLVPVEVQNLGDPISTVMAVASMVVGQYYMTQINTELRNIRNGIDKISDFQDNEYMSRVFSLIEHVKKVSEFQSEIIENDELRLSKIHQLDSLEEKCTQLLGQSNLTLVGFSKKKDIDYESYERELGNAQQWFEYQRLLLDVLYTISDLRYVLYLGRVSRENCKSLFLIYTKQVNDTQIMLANWHKEMVQRLNINIKETRRKREGFDKFFYAIPALFDDNYNFKSMSGKTAQMISIQTTGHYGTHQIRSSDFYSEEVQLISKNGKFYYLPVENVNNIH